MDRKIRIKRYQCDLDFAAHEARSGSHVLLEEKHVYEPTTILSEWERERFCGTRSLCYHVMLFRVSGPGWVSLCPGGGVLAQRPLSGAAPGRNAPAAVVDRWAPSAPASSAWTVHPLPGCCRKYVLRHLRHRVAPARLG